MHKVVCDACGKEGANNTFSYRCHLDEPTACGYVDGDGNPISGREVTVDLCNACYNRVVGKAVEVLKAMMEIPHG